MKMDHNAPYEYDRYNTAKLNPEQLQQIKFLEDSLRSSTDKEVILIAYEESEHNPT